MSYFNATNYLFIWSASAKWLIVVSRALRPQYDAYISCMLHFQTAPNRLRDNQTITVNLDYLIRNQELSKNLILCTQLIELYRTITNRNFFYSNVKFNSCDFVFLQSSTPSYIVDIRKTRKFTPSRFLNLKEMRHFWIYGLYQIYTHANWEYGLEIWKVLNNNHYIGWNLWLIFQRYN